MLLLMSLNRGLKLQICYSMKISGKNECSHFTCDLVTCIGLIGLIRELAQGEGERMNNW